MSREKKDKEIELTNQRNALIYYYERSELYEFAYLSLYLVPNSKSALLWFYNQSSTKENFMLQFRFPILIAYPHREREVIFSTLLVNGLIEQAGVLFKISEKGIKFLKYIRYIS